MSPIGTSKRPLPTINFCRETVHLCPFCDWSLFYTEYDPEGVEAALADHLDEVHNLVHRATCNWMGYLWT